MQQKILFLTTHNLATNPRLVKEIKLALKNNFSVSLICFEFDNWSKPYNEQLKKELADVQMICIPAGRKPFFNWFWSVALEQVCRKLIRIYSPDSWLANAVSRRSSLLIKHLNDVARPDWVIGHNPGALYATHVAAQKMNCKAGFDVEDYHPGEGNHVLLQRLSKQLMQRLLPRMNYSSFASPLIMEEVKKDIAPDVKNWFTVCNFFPAEEFVEPKQKSNDSLKLVWFSQNISFGRGLEEFIGAMACLENVELHLFGNTNEVFKKQWLEERANIFIHPPLAQEQLHIKLADFDIGLALEPGKDFNNELALSNKILAYYQAGLYILASNTKAQQRFIDEHPEHGRVIPLQKDALKKSISELFAQKEFINQNALKRYRAAASENWETQSLMLLDTWSQSNS